LADVHPQGAEGFESVYLGIKTASVSPQIEMQSIFHLFGLRHGEYVQRRLVSGRRGEADTRVTFFDHVPPKDSGPEVGHGTRFDGVDTYAGDANRHGHNPAIGRDGLRLIRWLRGRPRALPSPMRSLFEPSIPENASVVTVHWEDLEFRVPLR
jgi:hypothetical protein